MICSLKGNLGGIGLRVACPGESCVARTLVPVACVDDFRPRTEDEFLVRRDAWSQSQSWSCSRVDRVKGQLRARFSCDEAFFT
jgi:hypothetical protein